MAGYSTETVAQHTFAMLLYLLEKMRYYDDYVKEERYVNDTIFTHFAEHFHEISGKTWGIIGLDSDFDGQIIGKGFPEGMTETSVIGYYAAGGSGDKKLVYRTEIINKYPAYPVFEGEKYVALSYKYRLIDQDYKMAVLDEILCNVEYQPDGSSNTMWRQYLKNPEGWAFWRKVCINAP